jgi:hypothetical protein
MIMYGMRKTGLVSAAKPGRVIAVSRCSQGQMPGSGETRTNPVFAAIPTHPDYTSQPSPVPFDFR